MILETICHLHKIAEIAEIAATLQLLATVKKPTIHRSIVSTSCKPFCELIAAGLPGNATWPMGKLKWSFRVMRLIVPIC
jgi:hypothetical protein